MADRRDGGVLPGGGPAPLSSRVPAERTAVRLPPPLGRRFSPPAPGAVPSPGEMLCGLQCLEPIPGVPMPCSRQPPTLSSRTRPFLREGPCLRAHLAPFSLHCAPDCVPTLHTLSYACTVLTTHVRVGSRCLACVCMCPGTHLAFQCVQTLPCPRCLGGQLWGPLSR